MPRRTLSLHAGLLVAGFTLLGGTFVATPASAMPAMPETANPGTPALLVASPDARLYRKCRRKNRFIAAKRKSPRYLQAVEACVRGA